MGEYVVHEYVRDAYSLEFKGMLWMYLEQGGIEASEYWPAREQLMAEQFFLTKHKRPKTWSIR